MEVGVQNKKVAFIIQARMQSNRLPGKILLPMPMGSDFSIIGQIIETLKKSNSKANIYIATSKNKENQPLEKVAREKGISCFRGSENDVLGRFISILMEAKFDTVVRLTADNPIIDIEILNRVIELHCNSQKDYTSTIGLPLGMNFEVVSAKALLSLKNKNLSEQEKEHVTLYIKNSDKYSCQLSRVDLPNYYSDFRVTIDYPSDYLVVSNLFSLQLKTKIPIGIELIKYAIENYPFLLKCNQSNIQKKDYKTIEEEIESVIPILEKLEFKKTLLYLKSKIDK